VIKKTGDTEVISIDYLAGRKEVTTGNLAKSKESKKRYNLPSKDLVDLTQMGDGLSSSPTSIDLKSEGSAQAACCLCYRPAPWRSGPATRRSPPFAIPRFPATQRTLGHSSRGSGS
jgi:hypothetical protein